MARLILTRDEAHHLLEHSSPSYQEQLKDCLRYTRVEVRVNGLPPSVPIGGDARASVFAKVELMAEDAEDARQSAPWLTEADVIGIVRREMKRAFSS